MSSETQSAENVYDQIVDRIIRSRWRLRVRTTRTT